MSDETPEPVAELAPPPAPPRENPQWSFTVRRRRHATRRIGVDRGGHHPRRRRRNPRRGRHARPSLRRLRRCPGRRRPARAGARRTARRRAHARRQRPRRRCVGGDPAVRHLMDRRPRALGGAGVHRHRLCRARRDRRRRRARRVDPPAHGGDRRPSRRAGVGDRIVRRRGDAARCHPRPRRRRGRRAHPRRRRRGAGARHHRRAQPRRDRRWHRRRRPRRARRRLELAAGLRPDPADRRVGRCRRDAGRGAPRRRADPAHAGRPAALRRCHHGGSARLPVDRGRRDRVRALHQLLVHRRRQVPRSHRAGVARLSRRRRPAHARVGDVHRQRGRHRRPLDRRLRRPADAVARPPRPVLDRWFRRPEGGGCARRRRQLPARFGERRWRQPDGPRVDRPQPVRALRRPRGPRRRPDHRRRDAHRPVLVRPRSRRRRIDDCRRCRDERARPRRCRRHGGGRAVHRHAPRRPVGHARCQRRAAGVRREPRHRHARAAPAVVRPGRRRGRRLPLDRRRRHRARALHPVGLDQRRRLPRSRSPGEPRVRAAAGRVAPARVGDVHAPEVVHARRRAGLGRCADAVAHPRRPVLHRRSRRSPASAASPTPTARAPRRSSSSARCR